MAGWFPENEGAVRRRSPSTRLAVALSAVITVAVLYGWLHGPGPDPVAAANPVSEVGNARPVVLRYDGLMVRRCEALAVYLRPGADPDTVRGELHAAADRAGLPLTDLPSGVLSPATLSDRVPEVVGCLPQGSTVADADRVMPGPLAGEDHWADEPALTHDLAFAVRPARDSPAVVAAALEAEGILADALGHYDVDLIGVPGQLTVLYTGPLLGDGEVDSVRAALAHTAGTPLVDVSVRPRSLLGQGVDMRTEPAPAAESTTNLPSRHSH